MSGQIDGYDSPVIFSCASFLLLSCLAVLIYFVSLFHLHYSFPAMLFYLLHELWIPECIIHFDLHCCNFFTNILTLSLWTQEAVVLSHCHSVPVSFGRITRLLTPHQLMRD